MANIDNGKRTDQNCGKVNVEFFSKRSIQVDPSKTDGVTADDVIAPLGKLPLLKFFGSTF